MPHSKFTFVDLFCGAGGLSMGLKKAGLVPLLAVDSDPNAVDTYNTNIANVAVIKNVNNLTKGYVIRKCRGFVPDVIVGGPPCQGFSLQNRWFDKNDARNECVKHFLTLVRKVKPSMFVMENVAALVGPRGEAHLKFMKSIMKDKYVVHIKKLNAADFGVPQTRQRVFVIGVRSDNKNAFTDFVFPHPTHKAAQYVTVEKALKGLGTLHKTTNNLCITNHEAGNISDLNRLRLSYVPEGGGWKDIPENLRHKNKSKQTSSTATSGGWPDVFGRLSWNLPAPTITRGFISVTKGRFCHPTEDRSITPREAARLQSFPDSFLFLGNRTSVCMQIGNAVPVLLSQCIAESVIQCLRARCS